MTITRPNGRPLLNSEAEQHPRPRGAELGPDDFAALNDAVVQGSKNGLLESERELLAELVHALRTIRYGSIVLTVHDGQLVEINKSVRIRRARPAATD
jgi:hypothetical protein